MGKLTTHVLDTASGRPASGVAIDLYRVEDERRDLIKSVATNSDGRVDSPLLDGDAFTAGCYELVFRAGAYFRDGGVELPKPPFFENITIAFGIAEPGQHYHVPLLLSPYGYSTYRGS